MTIGRRPALNYFTNDMALINSDCKISIKTIGLTYKRRGQRSFLFKHESIEAA
jgi:hypothetical protein